MRIFVIVFFAMSAINSFLTALKLMFKDYPRVETFSVGEDAARLVEGVTISLIAAYILWG